MPLYQYECQNCGGKYDDFRSFGSSMEPMNCHCGLMAHRVFGAAQVRTSNTFVAGVKLGGAQFGDATREFYLNAAREGGVSPEGKVYDHRLAAYPGDPQAWVGSVDDVRAVLEERNWGCEGDLKVKCEPVPPKPEVALADDIVEDLVEDVLCEQLGEDFTEAKGAVVRRAVEDVRNKHTPHFQQGG
ncbi:MAG TPA: FmdB family zinc ribbon protein [Gemmataceae bacterium]|nr:FmdB family zinc ribbon protein [Gemmataceae bacterium]